MHVRLLQTIAAPVRCSQEAHMPGAPRAVIHINFLPTTILFDARPIWAAVIRAAREGRLPADAMQRISGPWGNTAIHLATRDAIMRRAVRELKEGMQNLCDLIPDTLSLDRLRDLPPLRGDAAEAARDRVLLAIDSSSCAQILLISPTLRPKTTSGSPNAPPFSKACAGINRCN